MNHTSRKLLNKCHSHSYSRNWQHFSQIFTPILFLLEAHSKLSSSFPKTIIYLSTSLYNLWKYLGIKLWLFMYKCCSRKVRKLDLSLRKAHLSDFCLPCFRCVTVPSAGVFNTNVSVIKKQYAGYVIQVDGVELENNIKHYSKYIKLI
jgi:hypothetical protein